MLLGGALVAAGAIAPASAEQTTAARVSQDAPESGEVPYLVPLGGELVASESTFDAQAEGGPVSVPVDSSAPVAVELEGSSVDLPLPADGEERKGVLTDDGSVLYQDEASSFDVEVVPGAESTRVLTILNDPSAPIEYVYDFGEGFDVVVAPDGSAVALSTDSDAPFIGVAAPWAIDANGTSVPTRYEARGTTLVQIVDHSGASYPVTADPTYSLGWGAYAHFNRSETATIAAAGWGVAVLSGACAMLGGPVALTACSLAAGSIVYQAGVANNSSPKKCLYIKYAGPVAYPGTYRDNRCK